MTKSISVEKSRQLDQKTINEVGIPSLVLMERAALKIYEDLNYSYFSLQLKLCAKLL
ncbi:carbohydrate kinase [Ligilactobacillus acidipiscis]|nr:carbohydrate kinase [Ligilactobacillus acidipiscis]